METEKQVYVGIGKYAVLDEDYSLCFVGTQSQCEAKCEEWNSHVEEDDWAVSFHVVQLCAGYWEYAP